ncbi:hypothetical protein CTAYLR_000182 [Chrysophaeum taylorii]|uniref:DNA-directed RNA polymerase III subunit RPC9 n=1 Tax=Chrysophaeum taylorii TaxID=2483200 RepID=A0AAD7UF49_9STRA|nr:hypothetical protein CTAYLR_000182 [Chrysophaeum taylorii]
MESPGKIGFATKPTAAKKRLGKDKQLKEADEVMKLALEYLDKQPAAAQNTEQVAECLKFLRGADGATDLKLRPEERIQVINLAPANPVAVHAIIDDCDSRFSDEDIEEILKLSKAHLQRPEVPKS